MASSGAGLSLGVPRGRRTKPSSDDAVRATDSDALLSRISALRLGYLPDDPFSEELLTLPPNSPSFKRPPLINIGTYLRCQSIDKLVKSFLLSQDDKGKGKQIISLGAGSDSRYWRIMSDPELSPHLASYLELDFDQLTRKKVASIRRSSRLQSLLSNSTVEEDRVRSDRYALLPLDLRTFASPSSNEVESAFEHLDPERPTLLLFECVLSYVEAEQADAMISWLGERFERIAAVGYDMCIAGEDGEEGQASRFGRVMLQNLETRGLGLPGAKAYATIGSQSARYARLWSGIRQTRGQSLFSVWDTLEKGEKDRISRLQGLDEVEELDMLLKHYCITLAVKGLEI